MSGDPILGGAKSHAEPEVKQKVGVKVRASVRGGCATPPFLPWCWAAISGLPGGSHCCRLDAWPLVPEVQSPHWEGPPAFTSGSQAEFRVVCTLSKVPGFCSQPPSGGSLWCPEELAGQETDTCMPGTPQPHRTLPRPTFLALGEIIGLQGIFDTSAEKKQKALLL